MKIVKCLVTPDQLIVKLIIGGGRGKEGVPIGDEHVENLDYLGADGEEVNFLIQTRFIRNNKF